MNFTGYLQQNKYSPATIDTYGIYSKRFLSWLGDEDISSEAFTYNDLLEFMRYCQRSGTTKGTVHNILSVVRHYCNWLIAEGKRNDNPAAGVFIKGLVKKLPSHLLSMEAMEELYKQYSIQLNVDASRKIMLGLLVYQGVTVGELIRIEARHIQLHEGKIFIKGTKRSNERLLTLQALQITGLQSYLQKNRFKEGSIFIEPVRKEVSERNIDNRIKYMFGQLKKLNEKVINAKQIRNSVITFWLRHNNLRQVQYMAGHKYVSSTQRYQTNNLDDLQNELKEHHPMK